MHYALFPTSLGECGIAWRGDLVCATRLPGKSAAETAERLAARAGGATKGAPPPAIGRAIAAITALLDGEKTDLAFVACDFDGIDPFAAEVYVHTRAIPAGETSTYGAIAARMGDKRLAQNVGRALGLNPFPIVVPCHRVLGADGKLTGFSAPGGVETKLKMLAIEGARLGEAPGLFGDLPLAAKPRA
ncbi:MAG: methylated-DNA--[protein]-cysteine S-methyltransferase [Tagaea sp.]